MDIEVGTSGWSFYDEENLVYPKGIKSKDRLEYYSKEFNIVEVNTTFYHFPRNTTIEKWFAETDENFKFIIKINRYFTHLKKLNIDEEYLERLKVFIDLIEGLGDKLAGVLVQLPPSIKLDLEKMDKFLNHITNIKKPSTKIFLEIRDDSWIVEEFFELLKTYKVNLVYNDADNKWPRILKLTGDTLYLRLHGREKLYYSSYSEEELKGFLEEIKEAEAKAYVFFNNTASSNGIKNALEFKGLL